MSGIEIFVGECHVVELEILHAEEELWQMCALKEAGGRAVSRDGLVVLAFRGKGVCEAYPCRTEVWVHH